MPNLTYLYNLPLSTTYYPTKGLSVTVTQQMASQQHYKMALSSTYPLFLLIIWLERKIFKGMCIYISMPKHQRNANIYRNSSNMNNLNEMTKDEIYNMIQGQLAKRPAKRDVKQRQIRRQGTKYNVKPLKEIVKERIKYYEDKARKTESVITYDKKSVSIAGMRHDEFDASNTLRNKPYSSFQNLFNEWLKNIPGKREKIKIAINADVENMIGNKSTITPKTYGPFNMTVPKLDNKGMYKYMIYTLLRNNFNTL